MTPPTRLRQLPAGSRRHGADQPAVLPAARLRGRRPARPRSSRRRLGATTSAVAATAAPRAGADRHLLAQPRRHLRHPSQPGRRPQEPAARPGTARAARWSSDGWLLRNKIVWRKSQPDADLGARPAGLHLGTSTSSPAAAATSSTSTPSACRTPARRQASPPTSCVAAARPGAARTATAPTGLDALKADGLVGHPLGKNPGDVWQDRHQQLPRQPPRHLPARARRAGHPGRLPGSRCTACRLPWRRQLIRSLGGTAAPRRARPDLRRATRRPSPAWCSTRSSAAGTTAVAAEATRPGLARHRAQPRLRRAEAEPARIAAALAAAIDGERHEPPRRCHAADHREPTPSGSARPHPHRGGTAMSHPDTRLERQEAASRRSPSGSNPTCTPS